MASGTAVRARTGPAREKERKAKVTEAKTAAKVVVALEKAKASTKVTKARATVRVQEEKASKEKQGKFKPNLTSMELVVGATTGATNARIAEKGSSGLSSTVEELKAHQLERDRPLPVTRL